MEIAEKRAQYEEFEKTGNKDIFENIIDSMIMDGIAGMNESFRKAISSLPKDKKRLAILSILDKDRNLFAKIKESITDINLSKIDHVKNIILMLREYVKIAEVEKKKFGEVMTPLDLVKEMLNTLPAEVWSNPNLKWLDPANGTGPFPAVVMVQNDFYTIIPKDIIVKNKNDKHMFFSFKTKNEANNLINYLKSNFTRFCLSIYKNNSQLDRGELELIPWLDFSREWTDEDLIKEFELTPEEVEFINKHIPKYY